MSKTWSFTLAVYPLLLSKVLRHFIPLLPSSLNRILSLAVWKFRRIINLNPCSLRANWILFTLLALFRALWTTTFFSSLQCSFVELWKTSCWFSPPRRASLYLQSTTFQDGPTQFSPATLCFKSGGICTQLAQRSASLWDQWCFLARKYHLLISKEKTGFSYVHQGTDVKLKTKWGVCVHYQGLLTNNVMS